MAVGNQAGKTFVWDIGVDDPTKARYSVLLVNVLCCAFKCEIFISTEAKSMSCFCTCSYIKYENFWRFFFKTEKLT